MFSTILWASYPKLYFLDLYVAFTSNAVLNFVLKLTPPSSVLTRTYGKFMAPHHMHFLQCMHLNLLSQT